MSGSARRHASRSSCCERVPVKRTLSPGGRLSSAPREGGPGKRGARVEGRLARLLVVVLRADRVGDAVLDGPHARLVRDAVGAAAAGQQQEGCCCAAEEAAHAHGTRVGLPWFPLQLRRLVCLPWAGGVSQCGVSGGVIHGTCRSRRWIFPRCQRTWCRRQRSTRFGELLWTSANADGRHGACCSRSASTTGSQQQGNAHILAAMVNAGEPVLVGDQLLYLGCDDRGIELEIVAVSDDSGRAELTVITRCPPS